MKREIKFRVWNGMEMIYDITVGRFGVFYVNPEAKGDGLNPKDTASLTENTTKYPENIPVMQFTGLKDKNGKEIYEEDIVKAIKSGSLKEVIRSVIYQDHGYWLNDEEFGWEGEGLYQWGLIEVIGNIYENPELLG